MLSGRPSSPRAATSRVEANIIFECPYWWRLRLANWLVLLSDHFSPLKLAAFSLVTKELFLLDVNVNRDLLGTFQFLLVDDSFVICIIWLSLALQLVGCISDWPWFGRGLSACSILGLVCLCQFNLELGLYLWSIGDKLVVNFRL